MAEQKLSEKDKSSLIGCGVFIILFIVGFSFFNSLKFGDDKKDKTTQIPVDSVFIHRQAIIDMIILKGKTFIKKDDIDGMKRYVHSAIESARFMDLVVADKDYDNAIGLYPDDFLEQEDYYMNKKNDKPIYVKLDKFEKDNFDAYFDKMQSEVDDRINELLK